MINRKIKKDPVIITGATGFIGRALTRHFLGKGYRVVGLSRNPGIKDPESRETVTCERWNPKNLDGWENVLAGAYAVINLAGANIGTSLWTKKTRNLILNSRIQAARTLADAFRKIGEKPGTFIQISGIGYYGSRADEPLDENSANGKGFLAAVSREWESATIELEAMAIRRIICRTGMVLGSKGGALNRMLTPFRSYLGSTFGSGNQWTPWIHLKDVCRSMEFLISHPQLEGIFNLTTPHPITNREWTRTVASILGKPAFLKLPAWAIKIFLGKMGDELLLSSQRVIPRKLLDTGFEFEFPDLASALADILN